MKQDINKFIFSDESRATIDCTDEYMQEKGPSMVVLSPDYLINKRQQGGWGQVLFWAAIIHWLNYWLNYLKHRKVWNSIHKTITAS